MASVGCDFSPTCGVVDQRADADVCCDNCCSFIFVFQLVECVSELTITADRGAVSEDYKLVLRTACGTVLWYAALCAWSEVENKE